MIMNFYMEKIHKELVRHTERKGLKAIFKLPPTGSAALFFQSCFSCLADLFTPGLLSHSECLLPLAWKACFSDSGQLAAKCSWTSSFLMNKPAHTGHMA